MAEKQKRKYEARPLARIEVANGEAVEGAVNTALSFFDGDASKVEIRERSFNDKGTPQDVAVAGFRFLKDGETITVVGSAVRDFYNLLSNEGPKTVQITRDKMGETMTALVNHALAQNPQQKTGQKAKAPVYLQLVMPSVAAATAAQAEIDGTDGDADQGSEG